MPFLAKFPSGVVLVVDDDAHTVSAVKRALRSHVATILTATNGEDALHLARRHAIDVIVSDSLAQPLTGIELFRRAKAYSPHLSTILLSGGSLPADIRLAERDGVLGRFIGKPWDNGELVAAVFDAIARARRQ